MVLAHPGKVTGLEHPIFWAGRIWGVDEVQQEGVGNADSTQETVPSKALPAEAVWQTLWNSKPVENLQTTPCPWVVHAQGCVSLHSLSVHSLHSPLPCWESPS